MLFEKNTAYLIDTENVGSTWTNLLIENMKKMDLYVFVTENAKALNYTLLHEFTTNRINLNIIDCETGKNSLDFYLSSYLGFLIGKNANSNYVVVSQDNGFDHVIDYWNKQGIKVERIDTKPAVVNKNAKKKEIKKRPKTTLVSSETRVIEKKKVENKDKSVPVKKEVKQVKKTKISQEEFLKTRLKDYTSEQIQNVKKILDSIASKESQDVYVALVKRLKQEEGLKTYNLLKKSLRKYYSLSENEESK